MSYLIQTIRYNGYRCSCCRRDYCSHETVEDLETALKALPSEFPPENEGGLVSITITDTSTSKEIAKSHVSFAPSWQRGDANAFTAWSLYIDDEAVPEGVYIHQIIKGVNYQPAPGETEMDVLDGTYTPIPPNPLRLITDRTWSELCAELQERKKQRDIAKAQADLADAERRLKSLRVEPRTE